MPRKKEKQVVLLTGASGGIGTVTAELLLSKGYTVYGTTRRLDSAPKTPYHNLQLDVQDENSVKNCILEIMNREGRIDILINNAGFALCGAIKDLSVDTMIDSFDINMFGVHRMNREIIPIMIKQGKGKIINVGTFGARMGLPFQSTYSASKAALAIYSDAMRIELLRDNIKVSLIEPGDTKTDFHEGRKYSEGFEDDPDAQRAVEIMRKDESKGTKPEKVAKSIVKAVKARYPKVRYYMGAQPVFLGALMRITPYKLHSFIIRLLYGVPKKRKT